MYVSLEPYCRLQLKALSREAEACLVDWELHIFHLALDDGDNVGVAILLHNLFGPLRDGAHLNCLHMRCASLQSHVCVMF